MPTIELLGNDLGPAVITRCDGGERLLDVCDDARAPVAFSCRSASCGICRVEVMLGAALLEPPSREELDVLATTAAPPTHRLACQAVLLHGPGLIQLKWIPR